MKDWKLELRQVSELEVHPRNPRYLSKHDANHLKQSILKFGLIDKPIITKIGQIIGGHQRVQILKSLGVEEVECWVNQSDDLTNEEIDELNIRLNKNTGQWNWDILANEWDPNMLCQWGFKPDEFDDPLPKVNKPKVIFEFVDSDSMEDAMGLISDILTHSGDKVKMKVKK